MSKDSRRKLSDFTSFAAIQTQQSDSEDPLFEFEAPKYSNLFQSAKNSAHRHSILDFSIDQRSHDDYWFTYSHYLHEEEDNGDKSTDVSQSTTSQNNNNQNEVNPMMNQSSASMSENSKSHEIEKHQEKEISENKTVIAPLKKDEVKHTVVKKVVIGIKKNQPGKENNVTRLNQTTFTAKASKKRKEPTSFSSINQLDRTNWSTNTLASKKKVEVKKTTTAVTKMAMSASTRGTEPILKKVKMTESTRRLPEKINEMIKVDLKKPSSSKISFKPEVRRKTYAELGQKIEKANNMRHSVSVKHLNNTLGTTYHVPLGKKSVFAYNLNDKTMTKSVEIKEEITYSQIKVEKEGTASSNRMLYEPPVHGTRDVRKWEKISGKKWYNLSCHERQIANTEIEKMIKDSSKTAET